MKHQPSQSFPEQARGMTRRALAKQHTRQRLLAAARRLFVDRGYEAATIRDIAAEAELSTGAVFASFSDKADLFNEVIIADWEALFQRMASLAETGSTADRLLALLSLGYELHCGQLPLTQAALGFSWTRSATHEARYQLVAQQVVERLRQVLRRGVERGELSADLDAALAGEMLLDAFRANFRKAVFDGWGLAALRRRLRSQIAVLLAGYEVAA
jgi:AcrR family transcriptional regulator